MLASLFTLGLQTATVSNAPAAAAMRCAVAAAADAPKDQPMRTTSQFMHLVMHAAVADSAGKPFLERLAELAGAEGQKPLDPAAAKAAMVQCDRQYPLARGNGLARLPGDSFNRDVMCLGVLSLLNGAAEEVAKTGDGAPVQRVRAALAPYNTRLTDDALKARGFDTQAKFVVFMGNQIKASMPLGNPEMVARACGLKDA